MHPRRIARLDAEHPAGERLLADQLIHVPVEHETDAFLAGTELQRARDDEAAIDPAGRTERSRRTARNGAHRIERRMSLAGGIATILRRQRAGFDVGLVGELHDGAGGAGARHAATLVGAVDAGKADVIVHHELPHFWRVVGPGAVQFAVVVAIAGDAGGVDHRPVGHIAEQAVGVVLQIRRLHQRRRQSQAVGVGRRPVALLDRVAAAERGPAAAVDELAAHVEILVDHDDGSAEVAGADGGMQPDASRSEHDYVGFVIPHNPLRLRFGCPCQHGRTHPGGRAAGDETAPAERLGFLKLRIFASGVALLGHCVPPSSVAGDLCPSLGAALSAVLH